jgi:hypothetical protein
MIERGAGMIEKGMEMTEQTDGSDKSDPYISEIDRRPVPRENGERLSDGWDGFDESNPLHFMQI